MKLLITGDLAICQPFNVSEQIGSGIMKMFSDSDINIVNLEAPVTTHGTKILKTGPNLKSHEESTLKALKKLKVSVVTLANNHILDYDEQGVADTLQFCRDHDFQTVGAGEDLAEASRTLFLEREEGRVAVINFAENEWASATVTSAGAHPMDIIDNSRKIKEVREKADYVIVIIHGGHEYYNLPSPRMQKQYRYYADQGADLVVAHHTHCISGHEIYNGVPIFYSLGNFLFTKNNPKEDWYTGLVLEVEITDSGLHTQLHPVRQEKETFALDLLTGDERVSIQKRIESYNEMIADESKLKEAWNQYAEETMDQYLNYWSPLSFLPGRYAKAILRRLGLNGINKKGLALYLNLIRCEAHRDLSQEAIKSQLKK